MQDLLNIPFYAIASFGYSLIFFLEIFQVNLQLANYFCQSKSAFKLKLVLYVVSQIKRLK